MAKTPKPQPKPPHDDIRRSGLERLEEARRQKTIIDQDIREVYAFTAPERSRMVQSRNPPPTTAPNDAAELFTSFGFELAGDFPTVILNTFIPQADPWVELRAPGVTLDKDQQKQLDDEAAEHTRVTLETIAASNFYAEFGKGANPDLGIGVIAMSITDPGGGQPMRCQAVPIRELEMNLGADGQLDDRFTVRWTRFGRLRSVLPTAIFSKNIEEKISKRPKRQCVVVWSWWRVHDDSDGTAVKWQFALFVDDELVGDPTVVSGVGSCDLVIGRFNASPDFAWPAGTLIKSLPGLRMLNELELKKIKNLDRVLDPPMHWPDDSYANVQDGLESGMLYKIRPGTEKAVDNIFKPNSPDVAIYDKQELEQRLRRLNFLDFPEQTGKTPPTLGQWADELTRAQQRIGTPGLAFWDEFCAGVFNRFRYLLIKRGDLQPIKVDGRELSVTPYNPAIRAAEQQEVAQFAKFVQLGGSAVPEEFKVLTDAEGTLDTLAKKTGANRIWKKRDKKDIQGAIGNIAKLLGGATPGAPAVPTGMAPPADLGGAPPAAPAIQYRGGPAR